MHTLDVHGDDGTRLTATRRGHGREPALVFVHGSFGGLDSWTPVVEQLGAGRRCLAYARRNHAPSDRTSGPNSLGREVADLAAVCALAGGRPHVVAGSHGATIALHAALSGVPVAGLVLFEPPLYAAGPALAATLDRVRGHVAAEHFASAARTFLREVARMPEDLLGPPAAEDDPTLRAAAPGMLGDLEALAADTTDLERWRGVGGPVHVLHGELTWSPMPETMRALVEVLPDATEVVLTGQSHFATHTAPDAVAAAIRAAIAD